MDNHLFKVHILHNATENYFVEVLVRNTPKFMIAQSGKRYRRLDKPTHLGAVAVHQGKNDLYLYPKKFAPKAYIDQVKKQLLIKELRENQNYFG